MGSTRNDHRQHESRVVDGRTKRHKKRHTRTSTKLRPKLDQNDSAESQGNAIAFTVRFRRWVACVRAPPVLTVEIAAGRHLLVVAA